jgi:pectinesterase
MARVKTTSIIFLTVLLTFIAGAGEPGRIKVKVTNPLDESRTGETVTVDLNASPALQRFCQGAKPAVYSEDRKDFVLCQPIDNDGDGKNDELIFQADFEPAQTQEFYITDSNTTGDANVVVRTNAMFVPQRKDDFAWENDKIAFRMYGPELQRTELTSSGIDVWVKSVKYPIMEKMYAKGHDYYHSDNGQASDFYNVGESLGCGGLGAWHDNKLWRSKNYSAWKIITNGPIRSAFELTYKPWQVGEKSAGETKTISLDLGSNFNRIESRFDADVNDPVLAVGVVEWRDGHAVFAPDKTWLSYWQKADGGSGFIGCAVILPKEAARNESVTAEKHNLLLAKLNSNRSIVYYAGACWSRSQDFDSEQKWLDCIQKKVRLLENPLKIEVLPQ